MADITRRRLTKLDKFGYGIAGTGDIIAYDFIAMFFLVFMTDIAGISPAFAGTILLLAVVWDAITDPLMGYFSDRRKANGGKRSNFMIFGAIPMGITMVLMFTNPGMSQEVRDIYFVIVSMIYWLSYTAFFIPYYSLGSSLTSNFDERTELRAYSNTFANVGLLFSAALPPAFLGIFMNMGIDEEQSWQFVAIILSILAVGPILVTAFISRRKEARDQFDDDGKPIKIDFDNSRNIFKQILEVVKIKPFIIVIAAAFIYNMGYTMQATATYYYMSNNLGLSEMKISFVYFCNSTALIIFTILLGKIAVKFEKKKVFFINTTIASICWIGGYLIGIDSANKLIFYFCIYALGSATYWTLIYTFIYDCTELDEFMSGQRRDGVLMSFFTFTNKLGSAVAAQVVGFALAAGGYNPDAAAQSADALANIGKIVFLGAGSCMLITGFIVMVFPITKTIYHDIAVALQNKKEGKPYDSRSFEKWMSRSIREKNERAEIS